MAELGALRAALEAALAAQLRGALAAPLQEAFGAAFQRTLVPAFEAACQAMFAQARPPAYPTCCNRRSPVAPACFHSPGSLPAGARAASEPSGKALI